MKFRADPAFSSLRCSDRSRTLFSPRPRSAPGGMGLAQRLDRRSPNLAAPWLSD